MYNWQGFILADLIHSPMTNGMPAGVGFHFHALLQEIGVTKNNMKL